MGCESNESRLRLQNHDEYINGSQASLKSARHVLATLGVAHRTRLRGSAPPSSRHLEEHATAKETLAWLEFSPVRCIHASHESGRLALGS